MSLLPHGNYCCNNEPRVSGCGDGDRASMFCAVQQVHSVHPAPLRRAAPRRARSVSAPSRLAVNGQLWLPNVPAARRAAHIMSSSAQLVSPSERTRERSKPAGQARSRAVEQTVH